MLKVRSACEQKPTDHSGETNLSAAAIRERAAALAANGHRTIAAIRSTLELEQFSTGDIDGAFADPAFHAKIQTILAKGI